MRFVGGLNARRTTAGRRGTEELRYLITFKDNRRQRRVQSNGTRGKKRTTETGKRLLDDLTEAELNCRAKRR